MLVLVPPAAGIAPTASKHLLTARRRVEVVSVADSNNSFPSFIPKEVEKVKDLHARKMASRIQRLPVQVNFSYTIYIFLWVFEYGIIIPSQ